MKKNKLINEKDIKAALKYVTDLPSLENKFHGLANYYTDEIYGMMCRKRQR